MRQYEQDLSFVKILSHAEARKAYKLMRAGDKNARNQLIESCLKLTYKLVHQYAKRRNVPKNLIDDMLAECNLKVVQIIDKWNPSKGKIGTFIGTPINNFLSEYLLKNYNGIIYVPRATKRLALHIDNVYKPEYNADDRERILAAKNAIRTDSIQRLSTKIRLKYVTEKTVVHDDSLETAPSIDDLIVLHHVKNGNTNVDLTSVITRLSNDERLLLKHKHIENLTNKQIGQKYGISRCAVDQKLSKLYANMRLALEGKAKYFPTVTLVNRNIV